MNAEEFISAFLFCCAQVQENRIAGRISYDYFRRKDGHVRILADEKVPEHDLFYQKETMIRCFS